VSETSTLRSLRLYQAAGFLLVLVLFAGLGGWAAVASISGAVIAEARVVVETNSKKVQHLEGGIVSEILTSDGVHVEAGQLLLRLDETETRATLAIINGALDELTTRQARLEAERDNATGISFPAEITSRLDQPDVNAAVNGQNNLFTARRGAKQGEQEQLSYRIEQLAEEIRGLQAQQTSKERQLTLIEDELVVLRNLREQGLVTRNRILALERELARLNGEHGALIAQIAGRRGQISETRLRIIQIDKNLHAEIAAELREAHTKIAEIKEKRLTAETRLRRTEIRAPRSGIVHQLMVHTIGGVIAPGEVIMLIVPKQDELTFEARVGPADIDQVQVGQKSSIRLRAFDPAMTPEIVGEVKRISPDSIADRQTGLQYYLVHIQVTQENLAKLGQRVLVPGMLAEAFIETQRRTVLEYLLKPLLDRVAHVFRER
jgi:membrane fusion protein, type I secretion system